MRFAVDQTPSKVNGCAATWQGTRT